MQKTNEEILESFENVEEKLKKDELEHKLHTALMTDIQYFEKLSRKKSIKDVPVENKIVLLRLDLNVALSPIEYIEQEISEKEKDKEKSKEKEKDQEKEKEKDISKDEEENQEEDLIENGKKEKEIVPMKSFKPRSVLDVKEVVKNSPSIQQLIDRGTDRILIVGELGNPDGNVRLEESLKPLILAFATKIEQTINFYPTSFIPNFEEKIENGDFPENSIFLLENLNFSRYEHGYFTDIKTGQVKLAASGLKKEYRKRLSSYSPIYINDALKDSKYDSSTISGLNTPMMVMGVRMHDQINKICTFFLNPISPLSSFVGGNEIEDSLLLISSLINTSQTIFILGSIGILFYQAAGLCFPNYQYNKIYENIVREILEKAKKHKVKLIFPQDFLCIPQFVPPVKEITEIKKEENENDDEKQEEEENEDEKEENKINEENPEVEENKKEIIEKSIEEMIQEYIESSYANAQCIEMAMSFEDIAQKKKELEEVRLKKLKEMEEEEQKEKEEEKKKPKSSKQSKENKQESSPNTPKNKKIELAMEEGVEIFPKNCIIIDFGPKTINLIRTVIKESKKIFIDGPLSFYFEKHKKCYAADMAIFDSLKIKKEEVPTHRRFKPVVLIHNEKTKEIFETMHRIVVDEEKRKQRELLRAQLGEDEDESNIEPEEESPERYILDFNNICDFTCFEGEFSKQILQGIEIPGIIPLQEKPILTRDEIEEDLTLIEDI